MWPLVTARRVKWLRGARACVAGTTPAEPAAHRAQKLRSIIRRERANGRLGRRHANSLCAGTKRIPCRTSGNCRPHAQQDQVNG